MTELSSRREAARELAAVLLHNGSLNEVRSLAQSVDLLESEAVRLGVLDALQTINDQPGLDEIWSVWAATRQPDLLDVLRRSAQPASAPPALWTLSVLALEGEPSESEHPLVQAGPEVVASLLKAATDPDAQLAQRARAILLRLEQPAAQDEVCRWVIERDHPQARRAALAAGYAPHEPQKRALFYLLTEQWEQYEGLDFDASLLAAVYETADERLRDKIAGVARRAGWSGFVEAVAGRRQTHRLGELSSVEWEVVLALLGRNQRWEEVWQLAQVAPPVWSARMLVELNAVSWQPAEPAAQHGLQDLAQAAHHALQIGLPSPKLLQPAGLRRGHRGLVTALAFCGPNGELLASASADRTVHLWRPAEEDPAAVLSGHTSYVLSLAASPDGAWLASGSADRTVRLWALPGGEAGNILGGHAEEVSVLAFSPAGLNENGEQWLASGDQVAVRLWQPEDGRLLHLWPGSEDRVNTLAFGQLADDEPGAWLFAGQADHSLHFWPLPDGGPARSLLERVSAWSLAGDKLLASASPYGRVRLWDLPQGELRANLEGRSDGEHLLSSPDSGWLVSSDRAHLQLWQLPDGRLASNLEGHQRSIASLSFHPDSSLLVSTADDRQVCLWRLIGQPALSGRLALNQPVKHLCFSPDGRWLAAAEGERLRLWQVADLKPLFYRPINQLRAAVLEAAEQLFHHEASEPELASTSERRWLAFTQALFTWRRRYDIGLAGPAQRISLGEFDIEIEG